MFMMESRHYEELRTKGFTVVKSAFGQTEIDSLDFEASKTIGSFEGKAYKNFDLVPQVRERIGREYVAPFMADLLKHTSIHVDQLRYALFMGRQSGVKFLWHTDHHDYYLMGDYANYINLFVPVRKPRVEKSNVTFVPFDKLIAHAPDVGPLFLGRGAGRAEESNGKTLLIDDNNGKEYVLPFLISDISETPHLAEGDLLISRGDVIHRTQDVDTDRMAVSFRLFNTKARIHRSSLTPGCDFKAKWVAEQSVEWAARKQVFEKLGVDELSFGELNAHLAALRAPSKKAS